MAQPTIGLGEPEFDEDLHKNEIDHDFFDNPAAFVEDKESVIKEILSESDDSKVMPKEETDNNFKIKSIRPALKINQAPTSLCFSEEPSGSNEETPVNCLASPNLGCFKFQSQNSFSTGKLLECLPKSDDRETHSMILDAYQNGEKVSNSNDTFMTQCASSENTNNEQNKLFDISSSSSDGTDSESECSEIAALDTDDDELVNLLEKYYDYIDLGESDFSDITEVSPLSSLAASPALPLSSFSNGMKPIEEPDKLEPTDFLVKAEINFQSMNREFIRFQNGFNGYSTEAKPLPPLIIHTIEDVQTQNSYTFHSNSNENELSTFGMSPERKLGKTSSLLMAAVGTEESKSASFPNESTKDLSFSENIFSQRGQTSASRVSSRSCSESTSSREGSSGASGKRNTKNYSFTSDQMKKIDRENSILLKKILDAKKTHGHGHNWSHAKVTIHHHRSFQHQPHKSTSSIMRQRQQKRIDHENTMLVRRIKSVKASKEITEAGFQSNDNKGNCTL